MRLRFDHGPALEPTSKSGDEALARERQVERGRRMIHGGGVLIQGLGATGAPGVGSGVLALAAGFFVGGGTGLPIFSR